MQAAGNGLQSVFVIYGEQGFLDGLAFHRAKISKNVGANVFNVDASRLMWTLTRLMWTLRV